eukprot:2187492-Ditylum_brightwellii.AAC.1
MIWGMRGIGGNDNKSDLNPNSDGNSAPTTAIISPAEAQLVATTSLLDSEDAEIEEAPEQCQPSLLDTSSCGSSIRSFHNEVDGEVNANNATCTPFHEGVLLSDKSILSDAVSKAEDIHADINIGDNEGKTPLHMASSKSDLQIAAFLLDHNAVVNSQDHACNTPLHYASTAPMVQFLLDVGGANPNIPNSDGLCALHIAILKRDADSVKCLIERGTEVNTADYLRWCTPLHLIARVRTPPYPSLSCIKTNQAPLASCGKITELLCAVESPSRPDFSFQDIDGNTPLHYAAMRSDADAANVLKLLLQHGADPAVQNHSGQSPMLLFCHNTDLR